MRIAAIGSRKITPEQYDLFYKIGRYLSSQGYFISSGNANGTDQSFADGVNSSNPKNLLLYLPWATYNQDSIHCENKILKEPKIQWFDLTAPFHPGWKNLSQGVKRLMARNYGIIYKADKVIALLNHNKSGGGGTGQGVRIANHLKIPVLDLNGKSYEEIIQFIES